MNPGEVIMRFNKVAFSFGPNRPILAEADFSLRERMKVALMGQNGAGKTTIFKMIGGDLEPEEGSITRRDGTTIGRAMQVVPQEMLGGSVAEFFTKAFPEKVYDLEPRIRKVLDVVNLKIAPSKVKASAKGMSPEFDKKIKDFSGGEQARLLLAFALIQNPDILLLDEPTNNLDKAGIEHLTKFLQEYKKTCIVISHDAEFLNAFTDGVLYLDVFTHQVEQYVGNYLKVVEEIAARIERERMKNTRLERDIMNRKEQMNFFAQKGGHMRDVARKMREAIEELEEQIVEMREEDRTIKPFVIPAQNLDDFTLPVVNLTSISVIKNHKAVNKKTNLLLKKKEHLLIVGPNGIGKSTLLESIAKGSSKETTIPQEVRVGYYRQDFSGLDHGKTVYQELVEARTDAGDEEIRSIGAHFLFTSELLKSKISQLSEGQKGLLCFAKFVLQRPGLLILDEPTNHINFRHLPIIAKALDKFDGSMMLVSHMKEFVEQIKFDGVLDLETI
jgi:ATP-binding cassette subfamily F protein 3